MKLVPFLLASVISAVGFGQQLVLAPYSDPGDLQEICLSGETTIHHIGADFFIASAAGKLPEGGVILKDGPWGSANSYFLVWLPQPSSMEAMDMLQQQYPVLYSDQTKAIVEVRTDQPGPKPFVHGGVVRISKEGLYIPRIPEDSRYVVDTFPVIYSLMAMVDTGAYMPVIQHLEDYGTRFCESIKAIQAQEWLQGQFEQYPQLQVEIQNFPYYGTCSDNVIATLPGTLHPDEYIVVGAHYDSYSWGGDAPGADDNASGTAAVLELARILSQFEWDRSIVFCAFSGEEVGLYGSEYYASQAQSQGMDILGYFNFDMIGYRHGLDPIHTDMIAPTSALELVNFYKDVVDIYLPDFEVYDAQLSGGDSDHTSFNNHGYMGIFPFEDVPNYSPFIHTPQDLIGPSVNSPEMATTFIQANLASVASLTVPYDPVGIDSPSGRDVSIILYPNPATDRLTIRTSGNAAAAVTIFTGIGQPVVLESVSGQTTMDVSHLPSGVYIVKAVSDRGVSSERLIINGVR